MASMKDEAMAEIKATFERSTMYQEGYLDGFSEGYDKAMCNVEKQLKKIGLYEILKGFSEATGSRTTHENGVRVQLYILADFEGLETILQCDGRDLQC